MNMQDELIMNAWVNNALLEQECFEKRYDDRIKKMWFTWKNEISFLDDDKRILNCSGSKACMIMLYNLIKKGYITLSSEVAIKDNE